MKKKILLLLFLVVEVLTLTGCGKDNNEKEEKESKSKKEYSIGDTMIGDDWEVILKSAEFVDFMNIETDFIGMYGVKISVLL